MTTTDTPAPPTDLRAEIGVVASVLRNFKILDDVRAIVSPSHLTDADAATVFSAVCSMADSGKQLTLITLADELTNRGLMPGRDAAAVLYDMAQSVPSTAHANYYAMIVREKAVSRNLISLCSEHERRAFEGNENISDTIDSLQSGAARIAEDGFVDAGTLAGEVLPAVLDEIHGYQDDPLVIGIPTGLPELDARIGGLKRKHLVTIGGAGKIGKTSFALNVVSHVGLRLNYPAAFISHEMTNAEIVERLLISTTGVPLDRLQAGNLTASERDNYERVQEAIRTSRIVIDDACGTTLQATKIRLRLFKRVYKIRLAVIDYFQLLTGSDFRARRYDQLVEVSRGLKQLANDLDIPVMVLAQLNAEGQDATRPPRVTDIEECKRIFKDSNVVLLLDREYERRKYDSAWLNSGNADPTIGTIDIAAIRSGESGIIHAHYQGNIQRWKTASQAADDRLDAAYAQQTLLA